MNLIRSKLLSIPNENYCCLTCDADIDKIQYMHAISEIDLIAYLE